MILTLRDAVYDAIVAAKAGYTLSDAEVIKTYLDIRNIKDLSDNPIIAVKVLGYDENRITRGADYEVSEIPVQIGVIMRRSGTDDTFLDSLVTTAEEVMETCRNDFLTTTPEFTWQRTATYRDPETELPFDYGSLLDSNIFLQIFTAFYKAVPN